MIEIENQNTNQPWNAFYHKYRLRHYDENLLEKPPLPSAWLVCPAIFMGVWAGAITYVVFNFSLAQNIEELAKYHQAPCWLFAILVFVAVILWLVTAYCIIKGYITWRRIKPLS